MSLIKRLAETSRLSGDSGSTVFKGINDKGDIVGFYTDTAGNTHGFLVETGGITNTTMHSATLSVG